jgi:hypothetical protein
MRDSFIPVGAIGQVAQKEGSMNYFGLPEMLLLLVGGIIIILLCGRSFPKLGIQAPCLWE